jgi:hypothetical protein
VIKFVSDLRQVGGFLRALWFPPPIKTDHHDITEILLKVVLSTINQPNQPPVKRVIFLYKCFKFQRYRIQTKLVINFLLGWERIQTKLLLGWDKIRTKLLLG